MLCLINSNTIKMTDTHQDAINKVMSINYTMVKNLLCNIFNSVSSFDCPINISNDKLSNEKPCMLSYHLTICVCFGFFYLNLIRRAIIYILKKNYQLLFHLIWTKLSPTFSFNCFPVYPYLQR